METPIKREIVDRLVEELGIKDFAKATIREVKQVAAKAEKSSGVEFIKMEMGIPGLPAAQVGVDAQIKALQDGIAHSYPDIHVRSCPEAGGIPFRESLHRTGCGTGMLCASQWLDARYIRIVSHLFSG